MYLFVLNPVMFLVTHDPSYSTEATNFIEGFFFWGGGGAFGISQWAWEPGFVDLPKRCHSQHLLHAPLHQRADYPTGR